MSHENGSYGGHSGGVDLAGALTRANIEARSAGGATRAGLGDERDEGSGPLDDNSLHAGAGTVCHACGAPLTRRDLVRVTPQGTRHDSCP